jgi:hypothetical protein
MPFEYEALVGHLYMVGGRSISAAPPGALVEVAPKKAARGREVDTIFTLVLPSGDVVAPAAFYEQMARLAADHYFNSSGSVTAGLRSVFETINQNLYDHNTTGKRKYEANMLCVVLHGNDLFVSRVGSGVALLRHDGEIQPFPSSFEDDDALFGPPLGVHPVPTMKMTRYTIGKGSRLALADVALADFEMEKMKTALEESELGAGLLGFKDLVKSQITLMLVEFVPPDIPSPPRTREGQSMTTAAEPSTNVPAAPPIPSTSEIPVASSTAPKKERSVIASGMGQIFGGVALVLARVIDVISHLLDHLVPQPEEGKRPWFMTPTAAGVGVLVPVIVVVLVVVFWVSGTGESEFELCVEEATKAGDLARSLPSEDVTGTLAAWNAVLVIVERCGQIRENADQDATLSALTREGQDVIDRLYNISRREATPIDSFTNALLTQGVLRGEDMYVLDDRNDLVYRVTLTSDGRGVVPNSKQPIPTMRRGAGVNEFTVGDLFDIAWAQDAGGLSQGNVLVSVDRNGVLVEYSPTFLARGAQRLLGTENWVNPVAMTFWQGRLYILDPGANQIWRYEPSGGAYAGAPTEYFGGQNRPNISAAVDFGIDDNGQVYIMLSDGSLSKFVSGENIPFGFASFPEGSQLAGVNAMFLNTSPIAPGIYLVNPNNRTIYETTLAGTFINSYRTYDEDQFAALTNVIAGNTQEVVYALSGNSILMMER